MESLADRIKKAVEIGGGSSAVARAMGIPPQRVSEWANGKFTPGADVLAEIVRVTRTDGHWLLTGEGQPVRLEPTVAEYAMLQMFAVLERAKEMGLNEPMKDVGVLPRAPLTSFEPRAKPEKGKKDKGSA